MECPTCGDCQMDEVANTDDIDYVLECPQCGAQWQLSWIGETDYPRLGTRLVEEGEP